MSDELKCRICGVEPAFEDGVCRWEECEKAAEAVREALLACGRRLARKEDD